MVGVLWYGIIENKYNTPRMVHGTVLWYNRKYINTSRMVHGSVLWYGIIENRSIHRAWYMVNLCGSASSKIDQPIEDGTWYIIVVQYHRK